MEQLITVATFNDREPAEKIALRLRAAGFSADIYDESHEQKPASRSRRAIFSAGTRSLKVATVMSCSIGFDSVRFSRPWRPYRKGDSYSRRGQEIIPAGSEKWRKVSLA